MIAQLGLSAGSLARQPGFGIGRGGVGGIAPPLPMEVHRGIARIIGRRRSAGALPLEALVPGPGLDQRAVDREVLGREQLARLGLGQHALEEGPRDVALEQPLPILGEHGGVPDRVIHAQAHEPAEEQVVIQLLHELPLAAHGVEHLHKQGAQELLRAESRADRSSGTAARTLADSSRSAVSTIVPDRPQRMVRREPAARGPM